MTRFRRRTVTRLSTLLLTTIVLAALAAVDAASAARREPRTATRIEHFVVLMQENHSFDNYFGTYRGADGVPARHVHALGPPASEARLREAVLARRPPGRRSRSPRSRPTRHSTGGGHMDGFVNAFADRGAVAATAMGYYDDRDLPYYWNVADEYVLFDRFFTSAAGGSVRNHLYWVAGVPGAQGRSRAHSARRLGQAARRSSTASRPRASAGSSTSRTTTLGTPTGHPTSATAERSSSGPPCSPTTASSTIPSSPPGSST